MTSKKIKFSSLIVLLLLFLLIVFISSVARQDFLLGNVIRTTTASRGDINGDGVIDLQDIRVLQRHLIGSTQLSASQLSSAKVSCDGQTSPNLRDFLGLVDALIIGELSTCSQTPAAIDSVCPSLLYGKQIIIENTLKADLKTKISNEFISYLQQISGQRLSLKEENDPSILCNGARGIFLFRATSPYLQQHAPSEVLRQLPQLSTKSKLAYLIYSQADSLWIVGNSNKALEHGFYYYLEQLGARWFLPNEHWTIIPSKTDLRVSLNRMRVPEFRTFGFFGTGGFGGILPIPNYQKAENLWKEWKDHNQFPVEFNFAGHTGELFNLQFQDTIRQNPLYLAEVRGVRQKLPARCAADACGYKPDYTFHGSVPCSHPNAIVSYTDSQTGQQFCEDKFDYSSYDGLVKLYTDWRISDLRAQVQRDPESYDAASVSVEPADGGGHDESKKSRDLLRNGPYALTPEEKNKDSSASDRVFHLANQVAKKVREQFPGRYVNLYGYSEHSNPPTIPIEPNTFVQIIPYAFQSSGLSAEEFIDSWSQKARENSLGQFNIGIYDYWSIPDWSADVPSLGLFAALERLRLWKLKNIGAVGLESTYSTGSMGITYYIASKLTWDTTQNEQVLLSDFYDKAFGPARQPMQRMFERWWSEFLLTEQELAFSYQDLLEADRLAKQSSDPSILLRINDFKIYLHYLRLRYEYQSAAFGTAQKSTTADALFRYVWRIHPSTMIHSYRIQQLLILDMYNHPQGDKTLLDKWNEGNLNAQVWREITPVTSEELDLYMQEGSTRYRQLTYPQRAYSSQLVPLDSDINIVGETTTMGHRSTHSFEFYLKNNQPTTFWINVLQVAPNSPSNRAIIKDSTGRIVHTQTLLVSSNWQTHPITLSLPQGNYYLTVLDTQANLYSIKAPLTMPFVQVGRRVTGDNQPALANYFFVPQGVNRVVIYADPSVTPIEIFAPPDFRTPVPLSYHGRELVYFDSSQGQGQVWMYRGFSSFIPLRFLNVPQVVAQSPQQMMVPREVKP